MTHPATPSAIPIEPREPVRETPWRLLRHWEILHKVVDDPQGADANVQDGLLIYLKPVYGREPVDVYNYAQDFKDFPHETTADQFFTESQFKLSEAGVVHCHNSLDPAAPRRYVAPSVRSWRGGR